MKILHTAEQVTERIESIAHEIIAQYSADKPLFVCLLKGAVPFTSKLMAAITRIDPTFYPEVEYIHVSAYGEDRQAGDAKVYAGVSRDTVGGRNVIVLDDCLDHGVTYSEAKSLLLEQEVRSVKLVVLANKAVERDLTEEPLISGFHTPDVWLVGMGMDDSQVASEAERWSDYIGDVSQA